MSRETERIDFCATMAREVGMSAEDANALISAQRSLHRIAELQCSSEAADRDRVPCPLRYWREDPPGCLCQDYGSFRSTNTGNLWSTDPKHHGTVPRVNVREASLERKVGAILARYPGTSAVFNGDPRGPALLLRVPSGRTDDWGQRGICVP